MGIFKNLITAGKTALKAIPNPIGAAIGIAEAVYDVYNGVRNYVQEKREVRRKKLEEEAVELNNDFETANTEIRKQNERNAESFADSFGDESYDVESANAYEIRQMTSEFNKIQKSFKSKAADIENKIIDFVQDSIRDIIKEFEDINTQEIGSSTLNLNISYLTSLENSLSNKIRGYIQNSVKRNLSIDNPECTEILQIEGKNAKKQAMNNFQNEMFSEAINNLWITINDTILTQNEGIFDQINNRLNALELSAKDSVKQLEEIEKDKQLDEEELKNKQNNFKNMIEIADWCNSSLAEL